MFEGLKKLNVGDITAYETHVRELRRKELISSFRELYGSDMPTDAVFQIDRELGKIKSIFADDDIEIDASTVQFLLWRSIIKTDPSVTLEQVGDKMGDISEMQGYMNEIMPEAQSVASDEKKNVVTP